MLHDSMYFRSSPSAVGGSGLRSTGAVFVDLRGAFHEAVNVLRAIHKGCRVKWFIDEQEKRTIELALQRLEAIGDEYSRSAPSMETGVLNFKIKSMVSIARPWCRAPQVSQGFFIVIQDAAAALNTTEVALRRSRVL